jgi:AcrR family transcriptional regulator
MSLADSPSPPTAPVRKRSTRDRPAKPPLGEDVVVDAALAILKSEGLEAVTMRRVARALDTGPASLYVYVAGSEGLMEAMLDRLISTVKLEAPDASRWRDQLHSLLARMHGVLVAHPGVAAMTLANPPTIDAVFRVNENLLGILLAGGLEPQDAAWACDILLLLVAAAARENDVRRPRGHTRKAAQEQADELFKMFAGLSPDRFPLLTSHAAEMVAGDSDERFRYAIDVVLDGILARTPPRKPARAAQKAR